MTHDYESICTPANICAGDSRIISSEIDFTSPKSLHNWWERLDLACEPQWHVGMIGMMFFLGWVFTLPWVPRLADKYGRKYVYLVGMTLNIFVMVGIMFVRSIDTLILLSFLNGCCNSFRVQIGFIFMMEMMPLAN